MYKDAQRAILKPLVSPMMAQKAHHLPNLTRYFPFGFRHAATNCAVGSDLNIQAAIQNRKTMNMHTMLDPIAKARSVGRTKQDRQLLTSGFASMQTKYNL